MRAGHHTALVVSSAHAADDQRLNRHVRYLRAGGWSVALVTHKPASRRGRIGTSWQVIRDMVEVRPAVVVLPNPELHVVGSLAARLFGIRPVIDIQENYPDVAMARDWIPRPLRPMVGMVAGAWERLGRWLAREVVVAAPELMQEGDHLVVNVPDPDDFHAKTTGYDRYLVVYVGDVTVARGAVEMIDVLGGLGDSFSLTVIGAVDDSTRFAMERKATSLGVAHRLRITGKLDHGEAWELASGAVAGLCLLRSVPAYRPAVATKIFEYVAAGVPPVVSDLPGQAAVVGRIHPDLVCTTPAAAATVIKRLAVDETFRSAIVEAGLDAAARRWDEMRPDLALQRAVAP